MDSRTQNHLNMVGTCISVAQDEAFTPVWQGKDPADFGTDLAQLATGHAAVINKAAQWEAATGGAADAKATAESVLEDAAYRLARACYNHFKKSGDLDRAGKVDYTRTEIVKLRTQELVNQSTAIRDLAQAAIVEPDAAKRGLTAAKVSALSAAITAYTAVMNAPRGQIVNRSALGKEIDTDTAALLELVSDMDDLVIQFDTTDLGQRFIEAWKRARIIVDVGGGQGVGEKPAPEQPK